VAASSIATTIAIGGAGPPPDVTAATTCGEGVGTGGVLPATGATFGVPPALGEGVARWVAIGGLDAGWPDAGLGVADRIEGRCVGEGVGRTVGRGVGEGDGGGVADAVTVMLPCIAAYPWMVQ
jgi:hypothetical protein